MNFYAEERKNIYKTIILVIIFSGLMFLLGLIVDRIFGLFPIFTFALTIIALIQFLVSISSGPKLLLNSVKARKLNEEVLEEKQLRNIVEELCIAAGFTEVPELYVIEEPNVMNAFATGFKQEKAYICVTSALAKNMTREEKEGVIAHELSHIRNRDILLMTVIGAMIGAIIIVRNLAWYYVKYSTFATRRRRKDSKDNMILIALVIAALTAIFAFLGKLTYFAVSRNREFLADATAVELTRNPYGLSNALRKIAKHPYKLKNASAATAHLFISDPLKRAINNRRGFFANLFATHPPIHERIAILEGKDPQEVLKEISII
jgi:heat shock protein HtpX